MRVAALLPGTGSRADFVRRAFEPALKPAEVSLCAIEPDPRDLIGSSLHALDQAAERHGPLIVGGISLGAAVGALWASRNPHLTTGVVAALPAWTGNSHGAPAALSATITAEELSRVGLDGTITAMKASTPGWLADELEQSWRQLWPHLPGALLAAASFDKLTAEVLRTIGTPVGIAAAIDDPIHPIAVAHSWAHRLPNSLVETLTLAQIGDNPAVLGDTAIRALSRLDPRWANNS
ncbi:hypothetical protein GCM10011410_10260 [Hoyosella rhizosphaerae]|uniref:Alpha/beta hydrolase n=1 Tax=Hoyosella rhizosphaerae TaxID=1755582 RepID=A0A916XAV2_9ACTN|nr:hypothetical protein GCM10011410_10260 [Hoyosella rhizosphaerae]